MYTPMPPRSTFLVEAILEASSVKVCTQTSDWVYFSHCDRMLLLFSSWPATIGVGCCPPPPPAPPPPAPPPPAAAAESLGTTTVGVVAGGGFLTALGGGPPRRFNEFWRMLLDEVLPLKYSRFLSWRPLPSCPPPPAASPSLAPLGEGSLPPQRPDTILANSKPWLLP